MSRAGKAVEAAPNPYLQLNRKQLADVLGELGAADDALKARIKNARLAAELLGGHEFRGVRWIVLRVVSGIDRLNSKALKKHFGLEWYAKWTKPGTRTTWTATRVADVPPPPVP